MAKIRPFGTGGSGQHIEGFTPVDPYYYEIDNRPLSNLADNDQALNLELASLVHKKTVESADGKLREFTLPNNETAATGSLMVYLNGLQYSPDNIELLTGNNKFRIDSEEPAPGPSDNFFIMYRIADSSLRLSDSSENISMDDNLESNVIEVIGTGSGSAVFFSGSLSSLPEIGSISFGTGESGDEEITETGNIIEISGLDVSGGVGELSSEEGGSGWIDYSSGDFEITFNSPPANEDEIKATYIAEG